MIKRTFRELRLNIQTYQGVYELHILARWDEEGEFTEFSETIH